jgi:hypothetical protein
MLVPVRNTPSNFCTHEACRSSEGHSQNNDPSQRTTPCSVAIDVLLRHLLSSGGFELLPQPRIMLAPIPVVLSQFVRMILRLPTIVPCLLPVLCHTPPANLVVIFGFPCDSANFPGYPGSMRRPRLLGREIGIGVWASWVLVVCGALGSLPISVTAAVSGAST